MTACSTRGLLDLLDERGPTEIGVLAAALETHPVTVTNRCSTLQSDGYVRQISGGVYVITDDGEEYLTSLPEAE
ncbi:MarR family transcriptional regulator [Natronorubrum sp. JWXQ-INN-674]|uniref:MarR family transcriptional regulator n=1 Tax=Natronorubrum halalkaliphilum TaxID=2691917 RepID=A0A6B0VKJ8_9EURY|nr:MarR family transcriptional regulator [Natronorubrum halalkaliphilum]MXV62371.1 MarR family transcriptional regulator [Natronorubrum halalkaliphilum]